MRPIIFLAFLIIFVSSPVAGVANACPRIPFVPESGGAGMTRLNEWCRSVGGTPSNSGAWSCVNCPASGAAAGTSTGNPYEGLLGWLFSIDANAKIRAERKAALIRQLEYDRQEAISRQQTAQTQKLNGILQRLMSGDTALKDLGGSGELRLKLGSEPILFQEYMSTPAKSTTSAQFSLKTGDNNVVPTVPSSVSSAGAATTTATTTSGNIAQQPELSPEMKALAEELNKLTPEQQQKLLEAVKGTETQAAANTTVATTNPEKAADTQLSLKITEAKTAADDLKAVATAPGDPESVKSQAAVQFNQLKDVTATQTQTDTNQRTKAQPDAASKLADAPKDTPPASRPSVQAPVKEDLELLFQDLPAKPGVQAPQNSDLDLLFRDELARFFPANEDKLLTAFQRQKSHWPGPVNPERPLRNPLADEEKWKNDPAYRGPRMDEILAQALEWPMATQERWFIIDLYAKELSGRYLTDKTFAAEANKVIDQKITDARKYFVQAKIKALENSLSAVEALIQKYTPPGKPRDIAKLTQNPSFVAERDRLLNTFETAERQSYTVDAKIRLAIYLELGLAELKNRR